MEEKRLSPTIHDRPINLVAGEDCPDPPSEQRLTILCPLFNPFAGMKRLFSFCGGSVRVVVVGVPVSTTIGLASDHK